MDVLKAPTTNGDLPSAEPWPDFDATYIRDKQLHIEDVYSHREQWWQTGESLEPSHVAVMNLSAENIATLQAALNFPYHYLDSRAIAESDEIAALAAAEEELPVLPPDARRLLREIVDRFNGIVDKDLEIAGITPAGEPTLLMQAGVYNDKTPELHVDNVLDFSLRHGVTLVGTGTNWLVGNLDPAAFDRETGDYSGIALPPNPVVVSDTGVIEQFATDCHPHTPPVVSEPELRLTLFRSTPLEQTQFGR